MSKDINGDSENSFVSFVSNKTCSRLNWKVRCN